MILGHNEIHNRLTRGEIFRKGTWDPNCIKEASYVLRIEDDGLLLDGEFFNPHDQGKRYQGNFITIYPGKIAILSTIEQLNMPSDLVGKIGIRLEFALLGLTGLMGIQVDPHFGHDKEQERLYIRVANFGNEPIKLLPGSKVFTFELHKVMGHVPKFTKDESWSRIKQSLKDLGDASWSYVTRVQSNVDNQGKTLRRELSMETKSLREHLQPLVLFGIFLIAVAILGASLSVILNLRDNSIRPVPEWMTHWGWAILLITLSIATIATAWVGFVAGWRFLKPYRPDTSRRRPGWIRRNLARCWQRIW